MLLNNILFTLIAILFFGAGTLGTSALEKKVMPEGETGVGVEMVANPDGEKSVSNMNVVTAFQTNSETISTTNCVTTQREDDDEGEDEDDNEGERTDTRTEGCTQSTAQVPSSSGSITSATTSSTVTISSQVPTQSVASYTMVQISTHNSAASCWSAVNGSVYDLTSFVSKHPGGSAAIKSLCGIDGSALFNDQHGVARRPASELASLKIGILVK